MHHQYTVKLDDSDRFDSFVSGLASGPLATVEIRPGYDRERYDASKIEIDFSSVTACDELIAALTEAREKFIAAKPLSHYEDIRAVELVKGDQIEMPDGTAHVVHHTVINNGSVIVVTDDDRTLSTHADCRISRVRKINAVPS